MNPLCLIYLYRSLVSSIIIINIKLNNNNNNNNIEEDLHELTTSLRSDYKSYSYVMLKISVIDQSWQEAQSIISLSDIMRSLPINYSFILWDSSSSCSIDNNNNNKNSSSIQLQQVAGDWPIGRNSSLLLLPTTTSTIDILLH